MRPLRGGMGGCWGLRNAVFIPVRFWFNQMASAAFSATQDYPGALQSWLRPHASLNLACVVVYSLAWGNVGQRGGSCFNDFTQS